MSTKTQLQQPLCEGKLLYITSRSKNYSTVSSSCKELTQPASKKKKKKAIYWWQSILCSAGDQMNMSSSAMKPQEASLRKTRKLVKAWNKAFVMLLSPKNQGAICSILKETTTLWLELEPPKKIAPLLHVPPSELARGSSRDKVRRIEINRTG